MAMPNFPSDLGLVHFTHSPSCQSIRLQGSDGALDEVEFQKDLETALLTPQKLEEYVTKEVHRSKANMKRAGKKWKQIFEQAPLAYSSDPVVLQYLKEQREMVGPKRYQFYHVCDCKSKQFEFANKEMGPDQLKVHVDVAVEAAKAQVVQGQDGQVHENKDRMDVEAPVEKVAETVTELNKPNTQVSETSFTVPKTPQYVREPELMLNNNIGEALESVPKSPQQESGITSTSRLNGTTPKAASESNDTTILVAEGGTNTTTTGTIAITDLVDVVAPSEPKDLAKNDTIMKTRSRTRSESSEIGIAAVGTEPEVEFKEYNEQGSFAMEVDDDIDIVTITKEEAITAAGALALAEGYCGDLDSESETTKPPEPELPAADLNESSSSIDVVGSGGGTEVSEVNKPDAVADEPTFNLGSFNLNLSVDSSQDSEPENLFGNIAADVDEVLAGSESDSDDEYVPNSKFEIDTEPEVLEIPEAAPKFRVVDEEEATAVLDSAVASILEPEVKSLSMPNLYDMELDVNDDEALDYDG